MLLANSRTFRVASLLMLFIMAMVLVELTSQVRTKTTLKQEKSTKEPFMNIPNFQIYQFDVY